MKILPAIDLKDGMCVRLKKGDFGTAHKVAEDALTTAQRFVDAGAEMIHMVDLDGARDGKRANDAIIRSVIKATGAAVELGGGIRSLSDIERVLELGAARIVIGSAAVEDPAFVAEAVRRYAGAIAVGIDAMNREVRTRGWIGSTGIDFITLAKQMECIGVKTIIFTDISKDGMLSGPSLDALDELNRAVSCNIVASGGVTTLADIASLRDLGISAVIAGKAVYTGDLPLKEAIALAKKA